VIYSPTCQLVSSKGACLDPFVNNVSKYSDVIEIICYAIPNHIRSLEVCLDAQLVVSQMNEKYHIHNPMPHRRFLRVRSLEFFFDNITYVHVPRICNSLS